MLLHVSTFYVKVMIDDQFIMCINWKYWLNTSYNSQVFYYMRLAKNGVLLNLLHNSCASAGALKMSSTLYQPSCHSDTCLCRCWCECVYCVNVLQWMKCGMSFFKIDEAPCWGGSPISLYLGAMTIKAFYSVLFYSRRVNQSVLDPSVAQFSYPQYYSWFMGDKKLSQNDIQYLTKVSTPLTFL